MNNLQFDYYNERARKARFSVLFDNKLIGILLLTLVVVLLAIGLALVWRGIAIGLTITGLAAVPLILRLWYKYELSVLAPSPQNTPTLDGMLASDVLGRLPNNPSPRQIAEIVMNLNGGHFFLIRFGIGPSFLTELSSKLPDDNQVVWQKAFELKTGLSAPTIDATMLLAALMSAIPAQDQLLAQLQLDYDDIVAGVSWYQHLQSVIAEHQRNKLTGGIGRDWSFGFTPLLSRFAINISDQALNHRSARDIEGHQNILKQMANQLSTATRQNSVLVGKPGVGKTTIVNAFAERLMTPPSDLTATLRYNQVMELDPASLLAQTNSRSNLENLLQNIFTEAFHAKNIILFLDNAQMFLQDGTGSVDLSNILVPILEAGGLRLILAMDEQHWVQLSQANPGLAQYMNQIIIAPLDKSDTMLVIEDQLPFMEFQYKLAYMYQSLQEAYRLSERYIPNQAMPGKALSLLEAAAQFADNNLITAHSVQQAVEKNYGVKVGTANTNDERNTLLNLEQLLHERMINQTRAVGVVSDALRRARAGVRNQDRPIGTFLFLGPTGVGKTELAKSLAAVYFGGEDRLIRIDLNEFGQAADVNRLIADS
ncbi:MAG TPA: AAA family ATPase, partial [Patescibacteria group bacterium]|nr:AAA family ATPase [Patescibacteria group bacterium]